LGFVSDFVLRISDFSVTGTHNAGETPATRLTTKLKNRE